MTLDLKQRAFKADEITYLDRKTILLDRMLLNLFELLRFDGRPAVRRRRRGIDIPAILQLIHEHPERFPGFDRHDEATEAWLSNSLLEIMNRGKPGREVVVGPRPLHLNAFKLANPSAMADHGASMQVWALLHYADPGILARLKSFFGRGVDPASDRYDGTTPLDLETLAVLGLVDQVTVDHATAAAPSVIKPLCVGQGHLLADDLRRLLAYEGAVPRHVLATYIRTVLGLHLALFVLRLLPLVPDRVDGARRRRPCADCPLEAGETLDATRCPYHLELVVDLTDDPATPSAALARASAATHLERLTPYVRAVILLNRVKDFAAVQALQGKRPPVRSVDDLLDVLGRPPADVDGFFNARISDALDCGADEAEDPVERALVRLDALSPLEKYVELVCLQRTKDERSRLIRLIDSLAQKNRPGGFLRQTAGARAPRWFALGSTLLETLVQIAVLERGQDGMLRSRALLIDDFVEWLRTRYGFVVYAPAHRDEAVPPEEQEAWRHNRQAFRERLHQIGFFVDLSDAYNSQTIRPRYEVSAHE